MLLCGFSSLSRTPNKINATNRFASNNGANQMKCRECRKHNHSLTHTHTHAHTNSGIARINIIRPLIDFEICKRLNSRNVRTRACVRKYVCVCLCLCSKSRWLGEHTSQTVVRQQHTLGSFVCNAQHCYRSFLIWQRFKQHRHRFRRRRRLRFCCCESDLCLVRAFIRLPNRFRFVYIFFLKFFFC